MLDYSEIKTNIDRLNGKVFNYMNARNVVQAQQTVENLTMLVNILKNYIDLEKKSQI